MKVILIVYEIYIKNNMKLYKKYIYYKNGVRVRKPQAVRKIIKKHTGTITIIVKYMTYRQLHFLLCSRISSHSQVQNRQN